MTIMDLCYTKCSGKFQRISPLTFSSDIVREAHQILEFPKHIAFCVQITKYLSAKWVYVIATDILLFFCVSKNGNKTILNIANFHPSHNTMLKHVQSRFCPVQQCVSLTGPFF